MRVIQFILISTCLVFTACETIIPIDLPDRADKLVVNEVFTKGEPFRFEVTSSKSILDTAALSPVKNASIVIKGSDGSNETLSVITPATFFAPAAYVSTMLPKVGVEYSIDVTAPGFEPVFARGFVLEGVPILSIDTTTRLDFGYSTRETTIRFGDPINENYYDLKVLAGQSVEYIDPETGMLKTEYIMEYMYYWFPNEQDFASQIGSSFFSDELFNGKTQSITISYEELVYTVVGDSFFEFEPEIVVFELRHTSEDYFLYHKSYEAYQNSSNDPFAQPAQVLSNIEGGFGVFAGYGVYRDTMRLN